MAKNEPTSADPRRLRLRPRGCSHCGGDAYLDPRNDDDWMCLQCSRIVPPAATGKEASGPPQEAA